MKSYFGKSFLLLLGSFFLMVSFQNCGQAGSLSSSGVQLSKAAGPLVDEVVNEMENQEQNDDVVKDDVVNEEEPRDAEPIADDKKNPGKCKDKANKDKEYVGELEEVLQAHACGDGTATSKKVLVCHVPPGNPDARHEICMSRSALKAHYDHGHSDLIDQDRLGSCDAVPVEENILEEEQEN